MSNCSLPDQIVAEFIKYYLLNNKQKNNFNENQDTY